MTGIIHISGIDALASTDGTFDYEELKAMARALGLRQWFRKIHSSGPLLKAAREIVDRVEPHRASLGVVSVGGSLAANHTNKFLTRPRKGAPKSVHPGDFAHTLNSALPAVIAEYLDARACAFVFGDQDTPFTAVLSTAEQMLSAGLASSLILTASSERLLKPELADATDTAYTFDYAVVFLATLAPHTGSVPLDLTASPLLSAQEAVALHQNLNT